MEPKAESPKLSFSIDSILSHAGKHQPKIVSPYKTIHCSTDSSFDSKNVSYGTEALDSRLREFQAGLASLDLFLF